MTVLRPSLTGLFLRHVWQWLQESAKVLHRLWLEVTGVLFFALAVFFLSSILRDWRAYQAGGALWKPLGGLLFMGMMAVFGVYSFWKARRLR
ncbi:MAG: hypothetical protein HY647_04935 [Acidobacteria bacterium]|nr:hypothetical protein [Acidobacteriota bacterium]